MMLYDNRSGPGWNPTAQRCSFPGTVLNVPWSHSQSGRTGAANGSEGHRERPAPHACRDISPRKLLYLTPGSGVSPCLSSRKQPI